MAYNPFLSGGAGLDDDDDDGPAVKAGNNPFLQALEAKRKKREEDAQKEYDAKQLKFEEDKKAAVDADKQKAEKNAKKNIFERAGDIKRGVGGFIKDAAVDVKDTTVGTWQGLGDIARGELASNEMEEKTEQRMANSKEWNKYMSTLSEEDFNNPEVKKKLKEFSDKNKTFDVSKQSQDDLDTAQKVDAKKLAFQSGETALNIGTLGITTIPKQIAKQAAKMGIKSAIKQSVKTGGFEVMEKLIKEGGEQFAKKAAQEVLEQGTKATAKRLAKTGGKAAIEGAAYGITNKGRNDNPDDPDDQGIDDYLLNAAFGAGIGFALPFAGAGAKGTIKKGVNAVTGKGGPAVTSKVANAAIPEEELVPDSVVQIKNSKTGELTYKRIPKEKYDDIVKEIDGDRVTSDGIAGKADANGDIYHITASSPEKMAKAGFKDGGVYGAAQRSGDEINDAINRTIEEQSGKYGTTVLTRVKNWVGDQIDPNRAFAKVDDAYAKTNGIKRNALNSEDSLEDLARRSAASEREAAGLFEKKTASGFSASDLVKKYKGDSAEGIEFNNYTNAKFDLEFREKNGWKKQIQTSLSDDDLKQFVADYEAKNPDALLDLRVKKEINDMAVDYMEKAGAISSDEATQIKAAYKNAVPLERVFPEDLARPTVTGKNVGSIAKQTVIQKLEGGSDIPLSNSFDTMLNRVYKAVGQGNRAKLAQKLLERHEQGLIGGSNLAVGAGNKAERMILRDQVQEINKGVRYLNKKVSMSNRQVKRLDKELSKLGITLEGKVATNEALKESAESVIPFMKETAPQTIDALKQPLAIRQMLAREYGEGAEGIAQMAADVHNGGWDQLIALGPKMNKSTAKSIAGQLLKEPKAVAGRVVGTEGELAGKVTTRGTIKRLLNSSEADIIAVQKKIANREPKLAAKLDEVLNYKTKIEANNIAKTELKNVVAELTDDPTTGKQVVSGIINGQPYKVEVPPDLAKAVLGLDSEKLPSVLKALAIIKKPFEVTWTGILNPVFSAVSFTFYDTPMSIINSPQGFKTMAPKAVIESIKSIRSSSEFQRRLAMEGARPYGGSGASSFVKPDAKSIAATRSLLSNIKYTSTHPETALSKLDIWGGKLANATRTRVARAAYDDALKVAKKNGENIKDIAVQKRAMENAALAYRTIMPDFDTMSNLTRQINSVVPFYAASVAGTRSFGKALRRDPAGTTAKALGLGIAPTVGVTAFSLAQPQGQAFYEEMEKTNPRLLDDNMVVVLPGAHKNDYTGKWEGIIKVPLAPEFRALNRTVWRETRAAVGKGGGPDASHIALSLFDAVTGGVRSSENPMISTRRILSGEDPRTGERIIKGEMANLPKEEQIYETTSTAGKVVGKVLGTSPIQGDKLLSQFGLAGQTAKNGGKPVEAITENVSNRFKGAYGESSTNAFYETYSPIKTRRDKVSREVTDLVKQGKPNEARRKAEEFNDSLGGTFAEFNKKYGESEAYDPSWDEMLNGLFIRTSAKSFKSRKSQ